MALRTLPLLPRIISAATVTAGVSCPGPPRVPRRKYSASLSCPQRRPVLRHSSSRTEGGLAGSACQGPFRKSAILEQLSSSSSCRTRIANASMAATPAAPADPAGSENPLLSPSKFPPFDKIQACHVVPAMKQLLGELSSELQSLEQSVTPTWPGLVQPLERLTDRLGRTWGLVNHLKLVKDSEELRKAVEEIQPEVVALQLKFGQSRPLYEAFKRIREGDLWASLGAAQQQIVTQEIQAAEAAGVALEGPAKDRFNEIERELAELATKFSNHVLDATKKFQRLVTEGGEIEGLPDTARSLAAQQAKAKGHEEATAEAGPWLLTLDYPCYLPVMQHCRNRALREEVYGAFVTRASEGELDNSGIIKTTLQLRKERAELLGFKSYAECMMVRRMATLETAVKLVEDLRDAAWDASVRELEEVKSLAKEQGAPEAHDMKHWDVPFWAERLREAQYELTQEELRPYFALPAVLEGLFSLVKKLFAVTIETAESENAPVWHPDVRLYRVKDSAGATIAHFYLDPYSRPEDKQGGAWLDPVVPRSKLLALPGEGVRLPVAMVVCNQMMPVGDKPSLMTFGEVETLFHEFGHGLQHMLTEQEESAVSSINNIEWDAVELPSQFMENWCYHRDTLLGMAKHHETGETLPEGLFRKILAARTYRAASLTMRQLHFASVDLELHARFDPAGDEGVFSVNDRVARRMLVMPPLPVDRFLCSFTHIFAGEYAAGYYGYKWAEVLSADAFSAFEDVGLQNEDAVVATGQRFRRTVLGLGAGKPAKEVFLEFRGRDPSIEPLLRHNGLLPVKA